MYSSTMKMIRENIQSKSNIVWWKGVPAATYFCYSRWIIRHQIATASCNFDTRFVHMDWIVRMASLGEITKLLNYWPPNPLLCLQRLTVACITTCPVATSSSWDMGTALCHMIELSIIKMMRECRIIQARLSQPSQNRLNHLCDKGRGLKTKEMSGAISYLLRYLWNQQIIILPERVSTLIVNGFLTANSCYEEAKKKKKN